LHDANDVEALGGLRRGRDLPGAATTRTAIHPKLRAAGWNGYWIGRGLGALRMKDDAVIILDPVNRDVIDAGIALRRCATTSAGNCTVSADDDGARRACSAKGSSSGSLP